MGRKAVSEHSGCFAAVFAPQLASEGVSERSKRTELTDLRGSEERKTHVSPPIGRSSTSMRLRAGRQSPDRHKSRRSSLSCNGTFLLYSSPFVNHPHNLPPNLCFLTAIGCRFYRCGLCCPRLHGR